MCVCVCVCARVWGWHFLLPIPSLLCRGREMMGWHESLGDMGRRESGWYLASLMIYLFGLEP